MCSCVPESLCVCCAPVSISSATLNGHIRSTETRRRNPDSARQNEHKNADPATSPDQPTNLATQIINPQKQAQPTRTRAPHADIGTIGPCVSAEQHGSCRVAAGDGIGWVLIRKTEGFISPLPPSPPRSNSTRRSALGRGPVGALESITKANVH